MKTDKLKVRLDNFGEILSEMAAVRPDDKNQTYYHGTSSEKAAKSILRSGIKPPDLSTKERDLRPRDGRVYLTRDLRYAVIYALGANMLGSDIPETFLDGSRYGYVFEVDGEQLKDIEVDEDQIGELVYKQIEGDARGFGFLERFAERVLDRETMRGLKRGDYPKWAVAGKKIAPLLDDWMMYDIIDKGGDYLNGEINIANRGTVIPSSAWKIDKNRSSELKRDGNNFFNLAEKVK